MSSQSLMIAARKGARWLAVIVVAGTFTTVVPTAIAAPTAITGVVSSLGKTAATLNGTVNPGGTPTTCVFEWGTNASYGNTQPCDSDPGSGEQPVGVSTRIEGLAPGLPYFYRVKAIAGADVAVGAPMVFVTNIEIAPSVSTGAVLDITRDGATLSGYVDPNFSSTSCEFRYGLSAVLGSVVPCGVAPGDGGDPMPVSASISGLESGALYFYRLVASNAGGVVEGDYASFTTEAAPPMPEPEEPMPDPVAVPSASSQTSGRVSVRRNAVVRRLGVRLHMACRSAVNGTCRGILRLLAPVQSSRRKPHKIVIGTARYELRARSGFSVVSVRLTPLGRRMVRVSGVPALIATVRVSGHGFAVKLTRPKR